MSYGVFFQSVHDIVYRQGYGFTHYRERRFADKVGEADRSTCLWRCKMDYMTLKEAAEKWGVTCRFLKYSGSVIRAP